MIGQEGFDRLRNGVVPVEIALIGEAIDLRFWDLYLGQVDAAALARAMCLYPLSWRWNGSQSLDFSSAFGAATAAVLRV
ncbi:MAG: hypothetical protein WB774_16825 [Xanthobacteraceae bacterium]|jgi:hypothetical protein